MREVRCLADNVAPSDRCDPSLTPGSREECNKQPCLAEISKSAEQCCTTADSTQCVHYKCTGVREDLVGVRFLCDAVIVDTSEGAHLVECW